MTKQQAGPEVNYGGTPSNQPGTGGILDAQWDYGEMCYINKY